MKKMLTLMLALASITLTADFSFAGGNKTFICEAEKVEGRHVTLKCTSKDAKEIETGSKYKLKKKIEGC